MHELHSANLRDAQPQAYEAPEDVALVLHAANAASGALREPKRAHAAPLWRALRMTQSGNPAVVGPLAP